MLIRANRLAGLLFLLLFANGTPTIAQETESVPAPKPLLKQSFEKRSIPIEGDVREGWQQAFLLPDTLLSSADRLVLSVKGGWLRARHESSDGQWNWQIVLCKIQNGIAPEIHVRDGQAFVEVSYLNGRYFIRESVDYIRALREAGAPPDALFADKVRNASAQPRGSGQSNVIDTVCNSWEDAGWFIVALGPREDSWNAVVRLNPMEMAKSGYGVSIYGAGHIFFSHGERWLIDDGELLVAIRESPAIYERQKQREAARDAILSSGKLPTIEATSWLNTTDVPTWESLKGKVVLIDFWGTWCGPCVAKLPETQSLHEKFVDRGFVVLGIHSQQDGDTCAAFVKEHDYSFPIAIDSGKTADAFAIEGWPTYFLVDRAGKVVQSFSHKPPTDEEIEKLLSQSPTE